MERGSRLGVETQHPFVEQFAARALDLFGRIDHDYPASERDGRQRGYGLFGYGRLKQWLMVND